MPLRSPLIIFIAFNGNSWFVLQISFALEYAYFDQLSERSIELDPISCVVKGSADKW